MRDRLNLSRVLNRPSGTPNRSLDGRSRQLDFGRWYRSCAVAVRASLLWLIAAGADGADPEPPLREIFVPYEDLNVLLEGQPQRVFLTRDEFEDLVAKAKETPVENVPQDYVVLASRYSGTVSDGRAVIVGNLEIEMLADGLHAIRLPFSGVGVRRATIGDRAASLGRDRGQPVIFLEGKGRHAVALELTTGLETSAAQQTLNLQLPHGSASSFSLSVPGDVEVKSGAEVIRREVDAVAGVTRFQLLPKRDAVSITMSLNNRKLQDQQVVTVSSVLVDEVTKAYERLHATVSLGILQGAVEQIRFAVPSGFEPRSVEGSAVARWEMQEVEGQRQLEVRFRQPMTEPVVLNLSATRTPAKLADWSFPRLTALDVSAQSAVVGLLVEDRLKAAQVAADGLIPINTQALTQALPPSVFQAEPGAPTIRPVVAWYAPQSDWQLTARFNTPAGKLNVTTNLLLTLDDRGQQVRGGFALLPEGEPLFSFQFTEPAGWQVASVTTAKGQNLPFERYLDANGSRVRVRLQGAASGTSGRQGIASGESRTVYFQADSTPQDWLGDWQSSTVAFPAFAVLDTASDIGALAVQPLDDMVATPESLEGLAALDENEKERYGLANVPAQLAWRYERPGYAASLNVKRTAPVITARTFSFLRVDQSRLLGHYELLYRIRQARVRRLEFDLPSDTPTALAVRGLGGTSVKEFFHDEAKDGRRRWTALLENAARGTIRLAVDFDQRLSDDEPQDLTLPIVRADDVAWQAGLVAVEGVAELEVNVKTDLRRADVGELVAADYQVGRRLLGAFRFVGDAKPVKVDVVRRAAYSLPPAIVELASMETLVAGSGVGQTVASFELKTKAPFLVIVLPDDADLWSARLDGRGVAPQRDGDNLLVSLPAGGHLRRLQLVYESSLRRPGLLRHRVRVDAPQLFLRGGRGKVDREVPLADLTWKLYVPKGFRVVDSRGSVFANRIASRPTAPERMLAGLRDFRLSPPLVTIATGRDTSGAGWTQSQQREDAETAEKSGEFHSYGLVAPGSDGAGREANRQFMFGDEADRAGSDVDEMVAEAKSEPAAERTAPVNKPAAPDLAEQPTAPQAMDGPAAPMDVPSGPVDSLHDLANLSIQPNADSPPEDTPPGYAPSVIDQSESPSSGPSVKKRFKHWSLEGVRSLQIDIAQAARQGTDVEFSSLGVAPQLDVTLMNDRRVGALAWALSLGVFLCGVLMTNRCAVTKVKYIVAVCLIATAFPLLTGLVHEAGEICDMAFFAACWLVPLYLAVGVCRWIAKQIGNFRGRRAAPAAAAAVAAGCVLLVLAATAFAQSPEVTDIDEVLRRLRPVQPIQLPEDAIIIPYDATQEKPEFEVGGNDPRRDKLLVPYGKYVELWNRAYPDQKIITRPPPAQYAISAAVFRAKLNGDKYLDVEAELDIDLFVDEPVSVALPLEAGVLSRATLDGKPARLEVVAFPDPAANQEPQTSNQEPTTENKEQEPQAFAVLHTSGTGRQRLELTVRLSIQRQGGWRIVAARLPAAAASALSLLIPDAQTEVRLDGIADRSTFETDEPDQRIETSLPSHGGLRLRWRPKVAEGQIDRTLTAESQATFDIQEDGVRLHWSMTLDFRRSQRDAFSVTIPAGYLVEDVTGANVRGWQVMEADDGRQIDVTLLKAVSGSETVAFTMSRRGAVGKGDFAKIRVPNVLVEEAMLHQGSLTVRRSPMLDVRTESAESLSRTNIRSEPAAAGGVESPLGIVPFQSFRFSSTPFRADLAATGLESKVAANVRTILRLAAKETDLEGQIELDIQDRPIYQLTLDVPAALSITAIPDFPEWELSDAADGRRRLAVLIPEGRVGGLSIVFRGTLPGGTDDGRLTVPRIAVVGARRQEGEFVVAADPSYDANFIDLARTEVVPTARMHSWLVPEQRAVAHRRGLHYSSAEYGGTIVVRQKKPIVRCQTVSNIRVTDQSIEETVLLDFSIREAGVHEVSFVLPARFAKARINAALVRQTTIDELASSQVRVRLQLQDDVLGQYRVVVEHDHVLKSGPQDAPLPVVEDATIDGQYVILQNAGRDEVIVEDKSLAEMEQLSRQQKQFQSLSTLLPQIAGHITQAYVVRPAAERPRLAWNTKGRRRVETSGARIGLSQTLLVVDGNGGYRGAVLLRVDNSTEQFLEIELPADAELWTATVAGEPSKPTEVPQAKSSRLVRVPLFKTALGDPDYPVVLKYGGRIDEPGGLSKTDFPLIKVVNISVELSQVRLFLPETHKWTNFGGTMGRVYDHDELAAGYLSYLNRQIEIVTEAANSTDDPFVRMRCASNIRMLERASAPYRRSGDTFRNEKLQQAYAGNYSMLEKGKQVIATKTKDAPAELDNRAALNSAIDSQVISLSNNAVKNVDANFDTVDVTRGPADPSNRAPGDRKPGGEPGTGQPDAGQPDDAVTGASKFNSKWFRQNKLVPTDAKPGQKTPTRLKSEKEVTRNVKGLSRNPAAPEVATSAEQEDLIRRFTDDERRATEAASEVELDAATRYESRLEQQNLQQSAAERGFAGGQPQPSAAIGLGDGDPENDLDFSFSQDSLNGFGPQLGGSDAGGAEQSVTGGDTGEMQGLSSLDVRIPRRGTMFMFTTPRGNTRITARSIDAASSGRLIRLGVLGGVLIVLAVPFIRRRRVRS